VNGLEERDPRSGRWVLYGTQEQHGLDCARYPFERIPKRVFLDTNVVNMLVKHADLIFEQRSTPESLDETKARDVEALMHIFLVGSRANWDLVSSSTTLQELSRTQSDELRADLLNYAIEFVEDSSEAAVHARDLGRRVLGSGLFHALPDRDDRELLAHAIGLGCDAFCTGDRKTIIRRRNRLPKLPLRILTPIEWWWHIRPWAGLWY
jgi:predicted nucleic acid-binding protein